MENIIDTLTPCFSPSFKEKLKRLESLAVFIYKQENQEACLQAKLNEALANSEHKEYTTTLAVLPAQKIKRFRC